MDTPCELWTGYIERNGYARTTRNGRKVSLHRLAYEEAFGPIPAGLQIDHLCRVRNCYNADHLEAVTPKENIRRAGNWQKSKTDCPKGHGYTEENTYFDPNGHRHCRACGTAYGREASRRRRKRFKSPENEPSVPHGTQNGYTGYACRCEACRTAHAKAARKK